MSIVSIADAGPPHEPVSTARTTDLHTRGCRGLGPAPADIQCRQRAGDGWIRGSLSGPTWLTGGAFSAEGSVVSLLLCMAATGLLLAAARLRRVGSSWVDQLPGSRPGVSG
jgi:hypothetical protein